MDFNEFLEKIEEKHKNLPWYIKILDTIRYRIIENTCDFFRYDLPQGLSNLFKFFKIVWRDRDWDYAYLLYLIEFKLNNMIKLTENYGHHECSNNNVKYMKICVKLIKILNWENYEIFEEKFGDDYVKHNEYEMKCKSLLFKILDKQIYGWWE